MKLNSFQLRQLEEERARGVMREVHRRPLYFILEDIYDTYNIGGLFRLADALAVKKIYLCGETETPPNHRVKKASVGTDKVVPWQYKKTTKEVVEELRRTYTTTKLKKKEGKAIRIVAIEQAKNSIPFSKYDYQLPLALVVGNESYGIKKETLALCDAIVEIPMYGINRSLNVIVATAIVGYWAISESFS